MLPPCPLTATRFSKPWWTSESHTSRKTCRKVVVERRIEPGNCMWYHESVTFRVGATRTLRPSAPARSAARVASERAMKQSVSSGMCGPCCSVVPIGTSTASTPALIRSSTSIQVSRSMKWSATDRDLHRMSDIVQYSPGVETEVNGVKLWYEVSGDGEP